MRVIGVFLLAAAVFVPSADPAEPVSQLLAISASGAELVVVSASGEIAARLVGQEQGLVVVDANWSLDGTRVAFTAPVPGKAGREVFVVGADGSGLRAVTHGSDAADFYNTRPLWISASEIVYHRLGKNSDLDELWVVDVETGALRRLVAEANANYRLLLQPRGSLLVYGFVSAAGLARAIVDVRTGERRLLPGVHESVAWSHDGEWLAYGIVGGAGGLHVMRPDGSDRRTLVGDHFVESVAWSPDDSRLAFVAVRRFPEYATKYGTPARRDLYGVEADGTGVRQLTGIAGDGLYDRGESIWVTPSSLHWWPDGSRLFFGAQRMYGDPLENWTMNTDGSCEVQWAPSLATWAVPQWRPRASLAAGPRECRSVLLRLRPDAAEIGVREQLQLRATVHNDGTQPLRNLMVTLSAVGGTLNLPEHCSGLVCNLGTLAPGDEAQLEFRAASRFGGSIEFSAAASYEGGPDVFPADDKATAVAKVFRCDVLGTMRADRLDGTPRRDRMCGRNGNDWIVAKSGNDEIQGGPGRDTIEGGGGNDDIYGERGADLIVANDGETDLVDCGSGSDLVIADRKDVLHRCEWIQRPLRRRTR